MDIVDEMIKKEVGKLQIKDNVLRSMQVTEVKFTKINRYGDSNSEWS